MTYIEAKVWVNSSTGYPQVETAYVTYIEQSWDNVQDTFQQVETAGVTYLEACGNRLQHS